MVLLKKASKLFLIRNLDNGKDDEAGAYLQGGVGGKFYGWSVNFMYRHNR